MKTILDLCGGTGAWSKPYQDHGYNIINVTLPKHDVRTYVAPENIHGVLAAPPCTEFSFAKHFHGKGKYNHNFIKGLELVSACMRIILIVNPQWWCLENPRGYLRRWLGNPQLTFDPCDYGDPYKKKTDLWGNFSIPKKNLVEPINKKFSQLHTKEIHGQYYGKLTRTERRAITPSGFAKAFFEANP